MNIPRDAATIGINQTRDAAGNWPLLSLRELNRLRFLAYRRMNSRINSPAPVRTDVDALCDEIISALAAERATGQMSPTQESLPYLREGSPSASADTLAWRAALASVPATFAARRDCQPDA